MRILILSVTTGGGHNAAADAIAEQFLLNASSSGDKIEVVREDLYESCSSLLYKLMDRGYVLLTRYFPKRFGRTYNYLEKHGRARRIVSAFPGNSYIQRRLLRCLKENVPDAIITTHVFAAKCLNALKRRGELTVPIIGVITDFCIHPFWEECDLLDHIVIADDMILCSAKEKGLEPGRLLPFGIPVRPGFLIKKPKEAARSELGLEPGIRTFLVMGGSMGYGDLLAAVKELLELPFEKQIVCVCARNKKLFDRLAKLGSPQLHIRGFINDPELYMDASDCIITKPGGITAAEILVKQLPAILMNPIPGPEERNMTFLINSGGAVLTNRYVSLSEAVSSIFSRPERLKLMERCLSLAAYPDAAQRLCDFTINLIKKSVVK